MQITHKQLTRRVRDWQRRLAPLGVGHFRIDSVNLVAMTPSGPDALASVQVKGAYDSARFWFTDGFLADVDEQELDETIIHEWLHVAFRDLDAAHESVETWMPQHTYTDWSERVTHAEEGLIDRLTRALYAAHSGS